MLGIPKKTKNMIGRPIEIATNPGIRR